MRSGIGAFAMALSLTILPLAGAKVMRGVAGYGRSRHIHESWRGFSYDLPVVVEIIDSEEKIDAFLPALQRLEVLSPDDGGATQ